MKNQLFFYKEAGSNFIVVHKFVEDGTILRYAAGEGEHGLDLILRSGHGLEDIRKELEQTVKGLDLTAWTKFDNIEEEMELTHFETCMGPVEKAYAFVIEW